MGGVVGGIAGGILGNRAANRQADATREATQQAVQQVQPFRETGVQAQNFLAQALGLQGGDAADQAFQNFLGNTGFQQELQAGSQAITGNAAARGLLNSGATARGLQEFGQGLAQSRFQNFLGNLGGLANQGVNAATFAGQALQGGLTQAAGQQGAGQQQLAGGIGGALGGLLPGLNTGTVNLFGGN